MSSTDVTAIVLAGGHGSRLGGLDKALLEVGGRPMLERVRSALAGLVGETVVVVNEQQLPLEPSEKLIRDPRPHAGVLPALHAALASSSHPLCILVACDMPFLNPRLLRWLVGRAAGYDVAMPVVEGREQPMHAVYRREPCAAAIDAALRRGDRRMISFLDGLRVLRITEAELRRVDPDLLSFYNVNTPEELEEARRLAARPEAFVRKAPPGEEAAR